eukprot:PhM_4_TR11793/c0_g1_i1/m.44863
MPEHTPSKRLEREDAVDMSVDKKLKRDHSTPQVTADTATDVDAGGDAEHFCENSTIDSIRAPEKLKEQIIQRLIEIIRPMHKPITPSSRPVERCDERAEAREVL